MSYQTHVSYHSSICIEIEGRLSVPSQSAHSLMTLSVGFACLSQRLNQKVGIASTGSTFWTSCIPTKNVR